MKIAGVLFFSAIILWTQSLNAFDFARDGRALCVIAIAGHPNKYEKMAADDMAEYLAQMTGGSFPIIPENEVGDQTAIFVGQTDFAARNGFDFDRLGAEEWVLKSAGNNMIVTGGRPIGTFYAAWTLLQKIGCWSLTMDQMVVPRRPDLALEDFEEQKTPSFAGRLIFTDFPGKAMAAKMPKSAEDAYNRWQLRSGMNGEQAQMRTRAWYAGGVFNISHVPNFHSLSLYVDPDRYFKAHPEYFSMNENGERFRPSQKNPFMNGSLCMSNPEVWKVTLDSLRAMIRKDRAARPKEEWPFLYDISILDASPYICKCPECTKISTEEGSECGLLLRYINYVATEIAKEYPEIVIRTFAYSAVAKPPKITRPAANVLLQLCDEFPVADAFRPLTSEFNRPRLAELQKWADMNANLMVWDYWNLGNFYFDPPRLEVVLDAIGPDLRLFHALGAQAMFIEAERDFVSPQNFIDLEYFVACQLMMDLDRNEEELIEVFMDGYYGTAAPMMKAWLAEIRETVKNHPTKQTILSAGQRSIVTADYLVKTYRMLREAAEKFPEGNVYRRRIEDEMIVPIWIALLKRVDVEPAFRAAGIDMDELTEECRTLVHNHIRRYGATAPEYLDKMFEEKFKRVLVRLPRPEKFKAVPDEDIRLVGYPSANAVPHLSSAIVDDPDSPVGKAVKAAHLDPARHGVGSVITVKDVGNFPALKFELGNVGAPGSTSTVLDSVPADEKYHWYKTKGTIDLREKSYFWGQAWAIQFDTSSLYVLSDGIADNNVWEVWFSAKFTGPAYVSGSTKGNAIFVDMVVLVRPGALESDPKPAATMEK